MMSTRTTSPSSFCPARSAIVPPIWPAPMSAIFLRAMWCSPSVKKRELHVLDDLVPELRALHLDDVGDSFLLHQTREVVRDAVRADGPVHALDDEIRGLDPAEVPQHH